MTREVPRWASWLAVALLVVAAYSAGRFTAPERVDERTLVRVVTREREVEKRVEVTAKVETRIVYRDRIVQPDGTRVEREVERSGAVTETAAAHEREVVREVEKRVEVERVVTVRPDWRVSITAGASLREPALPLAGPLVLGAQVDRRIAGGFSVGVWASTQGAFGGAASLDF